MIDASELERYLTLLESAGERIDRETAAKLHATVEKLVEYAHSIAHRRSGTMGDSIHQLGPFVIGGGILESQIAAAPSYTLLELAHGGEHDWATRTLAEMAALLEQLQADTGAIVVTALGEQT